MQKYSIRWRFAASGIVLFSAMSASVPTLADSLSDTRLFPENEILNPNNDGVPYFYGQINKGFLVHDDGDDTEFYPLVDNNNSSTRAGLKIENDFGTDTSIFVNAEGEWKPYSTGSVNQENKNDVDWDAHGLRKLEARLDIDWLGQFWVGQGSMASDTSAEKDLSGTTVVAYASISDTAGGQLFAFDDGSGLSDIKISNAFSSLDGLGRLARIRYDTPSLYGVRLSSSVGYNALGGDEDSQWDLVASYSRNEDDDAVAVAAAAAYSQPSSRTDRISASASMRHKSSGLSLTLAGGRDSTDGGANDPSYFYGKIGYAPDLTDLGPTAFSIDMYLGDDFNTAGSESISYALAAVQTINYADSSFDIYGVVRNHEYDDNTADFQDGLSFLTGARWKF